MKRSAWTQTLSVLEGLPLLHSLLAVYLFEKGSSSICALFEGIGGDFGYSLCLLCFRPCQLAFWFDIVLFHVIICRSNTRFSSVFPPTHSRISDLWSGSSTKAFDVLQKFRHKFLRPSFSHISGQTMKTFPKQELLGSLSDQISHLHQCYRFMILIHQQHRLERFPSLMHFFLQKLIGCQSRLLSYLFLLVTIHISSHPSITVPSHPQGMRKDLSQKRSGLCKHRHTVLYFLWYKSL